MKKVKNLLQVFDGSTKVYVFFEDTKQLALAPSSMWADVNSVLLKELRLLLGEANVAERK